MAQENVALRKAVTDLVRRLEEANRNTDKVCEFNEAMVRETREVVVQLGETRASLLKAQSELTEAQSKLAEAQSKLAEARSELTKTRSELAEAQSELADATKPNDHSAVVAELERVASEKCGDMPPPNSADANVPGMMHLQQILGHLEGLDAEVKSRSEITKRQLAVVIQQAEKIENLEQQNNLLSRENSALTTANISDFVPPDTVAPSTGPPTAALSSGLGDEFCVEMPTGSGGTDFASAGNHVGASLEDSLEASLEAISGSQFDLPLFSTEIADRMLASSGPCAEMLANAGMEQS